MAWRIVRQPNGKYARFADPVDNFTHFDMTHEEAVEYCQDEIGLKAGETKVLRADEEPNRWKDSLETIEAIHGIEERVKVETLILAPDPPQNIVPSMYYIQDTRSYTGNSVQWWRTGGNGYTCDLKQAWRVNAEEAQRVIRCRDTDKAWPCDEIDTKAQIHFDMQRLRDMKPLEKARKNG